ncbi:hypothetical protein QP164_14690 [Sphingomonas sp. LR59]|uniref:hypothetical protein n=1 Tax=Sphingomonas sp. LR59 TaxID=3050232 RepID=UPI002FE20F00
MKLKGFVGGALLTMVAAQADAATIWQKVETGMTRAQVEAIYPKGGDVDYREKVVHFDHVVVTGKCKADADVTFDDGGIVSGVNLSGNGSLGGRCADDVLTALSSKYGQPSVASGKEGSILQRKGTVYVWNRGDGLTMRFKNYGDGAFGGGGLGRKSWELRYSAAGEAIGL